MDMQFWTANRKECERRCNECDNCVGFVEIQQYIRGATPPLRDPYCEFVEKKRFHTPPPHWRANFYEKPK